MFKFTRVVSALGATLMMLSADVALAETPPNTGTWAVYHMPVYIQINMPSLCDTFIRNALTTVNNVGSYWTFDDNNPSDYTTDRASPSDRTRIIVEDDPLPDGTPAQTTRVWSDDTYQTIVHAHVSVNSNYLFYGQYQTGEFSCTGRPLANQLEFQSIMVHEFGHTIGLDHVYNDRTDVMYQYLARGQTRQQFQPDEAAKIISLY